MRDRRILRRRGRLEVVVAAVYALLIHTLIAGAMGGAMASADPLVLCSGFSVTGSGPGEDGQARHLPDCCIAGCPALAVPALPPPAAPLLAAFASPAPAPEPAARPVFGPAQRGSPLVPRGPPSRA